MLDTKKGEIEVDLALQQLAFQLGREAAPMFRVRGGGSIVVPDIGPEEVWAAIEEISGSGTRGELFVSPGSYGGFTDSSAEI